tara:strand:+ start:85 stop:1050 length:966 start_codon:yes stop_codon:yes gene_type:complete
MDFLINKKDKIFIAGHLGMAGGSILRSLKKNNYQNLITASRKELDLTDFLAVKKWFEINKPDIVIIAAAKVGGIHANNSLPASFLLENLKIQNNLIENSWTYKVKRLLFLGSSCIYPKFSKQPIKESELLTSSLEPTNEWYALAKISGLKLCEAFRRQYEFDAIGLMPTNLYGPGDNYEEGRSHVLPALIKRFYDAKKNNNSRVVCWGSGSPLREFLHTDDLGDACLFVLERWKPEINENQFLNVGTGLDITIKELAEKISEIIGYKGEIVWDTNKPDGTYKKQLDITKIKNLGWAPKIELQKGLIQTIQNYENDVNKTKL